MSEKSKSKTKNQKEKKVKGAFTKRPHDGREMRSASGARHPQHDVGIECIERSEISKDKASVDTKRKRKKRNSIEKKAIDWDIETKKKLKSKIDFLINQSIKNTHMYIAKAIGAKPDSIKKYMQTKNIEDIERDSLLIEYNRAIRGELKINNQLQHLTARKKSQAMNVFKQW